ncbi:MAG: T9SS type A sorting domain-containing protein [Ignavibacteriae bacterium]|nr:T9SS type A sorting domain-containing protein [Ignavibacteriota bacterium]
MKTKIIIWFIFILLINSFIYSQNSKWINYTYGNRINEITTDNDTVWVATRGGLVKINQINGETIFFNRGNSGIQSNLILTIAIDSKGNKWVGSYDAGISMFDGKNWTLFNQDNSGLPSNYISEIKIDSKDTKWFVIPGFGIIKYDSSGWTNYTTSNSKLPSDWLTTLTIDGKENIWVWSNNSLYKFDGINWLIYDKNNSGLPFNSIDYLAIDKYDIKWIGNSYGGLAKFDDTSWTIISSPDSTYKYPLNSLVPDDSGNIWIADEFLTKFNGVNFTKYDTANVKEVVGLTIDKYNNKWWGYIDNVYKLDELNLSKYKTSNSPLLSNTINSIAIDNKKNKWIGTGNGIIKIEGTDWVLFNENNSELPLKGISSIAIDKFDKKWIGLYRNGLACFDEVSWNIFDDTNSDLPQGVIEIVIDKNGDKWALTWNELVKFDGYNWTIFDTSNTGLLQLEIALTFNIDKNNVKWIGTEFGGLVKFDDLDWTIYYKSFTDSPSDLIFAIAIDSLNNKWIGTNKGLAMFDGLNWIVYDMENSSLPCNNIYSITIDKDDNKWIGAENNLVKFDGSNWEVFNSSNSGLPTHEIQTIVIDEYNNKWIGTNGGGLVVFNENGITDIHDEYIIKKLPKDFELSQNYPNPFNPTTTIKYSIPQKVKSEKSNVKLVVFDILGREVKTLVNKNQKPGNYEITFDGSNLSSGVYFYRLQSGEFANTKKLILMK